jgi:hypothetical protein
MGALEVVSASCKRQLKDKATTRTHIEEVNKCLVLHVPLMDPHTRPFAEVPGHVLVSGEDALIYRLASELSSVHADLKSPILLHTKAATIKKSSMTNFLAMQLLTNRAETATNAIIEVAMTMPYPRSWLPPGLAKLDTTPGGGSMAASNRSAS